MAVAWQSKSKNDVRTYGIDWSGVLGGDDSIATVTLLVKYGTVSVTDQTQNGNYTTWTVSGGENGYAQKLVATLTTTNGNVWEQVIWLPIISASCQNYEPSTTTKGEVVAMAFEDVGLPGYEFSASPEEISSAIRKLDAMLREWPCGQALGYNFPVALGQSDPNDPVLVPDWAITAMVGKLAQRLAPGMGKALAPAQQNSASRAYSIMLGRIPIPSAQLPVTTPRGVGNGQWFYAEYIIPTSCCAGGDDD